MNSEKQQELEELAELAAQLKKSVSEAGQAVSESIAAVKSHSNGRRMLAKEEARLVAGLAELAKHQPMVNSDRRRGIRQRMPDGNIDFLKHVAK